MPSQITLRPVASADTAQVARIIYEAFKGIADLHNFPHDIPNIEASTGLISMFVNHPAVFGIVAECNGQVVGSNFLDERNPIRGVGPITIDPAFQGKGIGRMLMQAVLDRGRGAVGIRLLQDAFNTVSMPLYVSLGFEIKEPIVMITGRPAARAQGRGEMRLLTENDLPACAELCARVLGHERNGELRDAMKMFSSPGLFRGGRLVAYMTAPQLWPLNHGVALEEEDLTDLILAAGASLPEPMSLLIPSRRAELFRWCLRAGFKVVKPLSLMTLGEYREPTGGYFPSVLF